MGVEHQIMLFSWLENLLNSSRKLFSPYLSVIIKPHVSQILKPLSKFVDFDFEADFGKFGTVGLVLSQIMGPHMNLNKSIFLNYRTYRTHMFLTYYWMKITLKAILVI